MSVYDLLAAARDDERCDRLATSLNSLRRHITGVPGSTYAGPPGAELDAVEGELQRIRRLGDELDQIEAGLPALEAAAAAEQGRARGRWVLLGLLAAIVVLILVVQGLL